MTSSLLSRFQAFASNHALFQKGERILAAVSGGLDSMVMMHLLHEAGVLSAVAHVNYGLRGVDSESDKQLVETIAKKVNVPFYLLQLETGWEQSRTDSIQMDARAIRYKWFQELLDKHNLKAVATAHHLDDQAETVLLHLIKGMPFTGFMGIAEQHERVIRPMLFANRAEIQEFANEYHLVWREDLSNETDVYQRNIIRHHIMPVVHQINPSFSDSLATGKVKASGIFELFRVHLSGLKKEYLIALENNSFRIALDPLRTFKFPGSILFHLIEEFGFQVAVCTLIFQYPTPQSGTEFVSATHRLLVDRDQIFLIPRSKQPDQFSPVLIANSGSFSAGRHRLTLTECRPVLPTHHSEEVAILDAELIRFPLEWRRWQPGDQFVPLGMAGRKKVSDLLIDEKIPVSNKEQVTVLVSDNRIVWVVGIRVSQEFCLSSGSERAIRIEYQTDPH